MKSKTKWKVGKRGRDKRRKEGGRQEAREEGKLWVLNVITLMKCLSSVLWHIVSAQ